ISLSTVVLAKASLLEGRKATVYFLPEALDELKNGGATYVEERVIVDGNIVLNDEPGLGFTFDEEKLAAHAVDVAGRFGWGRRRGAGMYLVGPEQT
ncbi:MAG: DJ-1/PfpI family protein, partial [Candidatus Latescibacteria bacterium]|nr:DJ-1/PfpI family protein [Candidatus Latescibacterota bacterium]